MIENYTENKQSTNPGLEKKITSYLDGSMSPEETAEFEAYVRTNPEFQEEIAKKSEELIGLKNKIPAATLSAEALESLESEMKQSIFNLLKKEPKNIIDKLKDSWEEWSNR